jgi:hypothetical protein
MVMSSSFTNLSVVHFSRRKASVLKVEINIKSGAVSIHVKAHDQLLLLFMNIYTYRIKHFSKKLLLLLCMCSNNKTLELIEV